WGGIEYHLDGLLNNEVVASDSFVISDLGGRDNPTFATLAIEGGEFDTLHLYATFDDQFSAPRGIVDNLEIIAAGVVCDGDVNGDGTVDLADLATLLSNFGTSTNATREMGDLDGDADIDLADLAALLTNFGATCP